MKTQDLTTFLYRASGPSSSAAARGPAPITGRARAAERARQERSSFMAGVSRAGPPAPTLGRVKYGPYTRTLLRKWGRRRVKGHYRFRMTVRSTGEWRIPRRFTTPGELSYP